jgi:ankyrin repeat protein
MVMTSTFFEIDCGEDEPAVLEITEDRELVWHGWDKEAELAAIELGFEPGLCYIIDRRFKNFPYDAMLLRAAVHDTAADTLLEELLQVGWIDMLLAMGADPNAINAVDEPILAEAAIWGYTDSVKSLIAWGADIHAREDAALRWAAESGELEVVKILLDAGADIHAQDDYDALAMAAARGHFDVMELLLEHGARLHRGVFKRAIEYGRPDVVDWLEEQEP